MNHGKKEILLWCALVFAASLPVFSQGETENKKLTVRGRVTQSPGLAAETDTVMILNYMGAQFSPAIRAAVTDGKFLLQVPPDLTGRAIFRYVYQRQRSDGSLRWSYMDEPFLIEDAIMDVQVDKGSKQISVTGGEQNRALNIYNAEKARLKDKYKLNDFFSSTSMMFAAKESNTATYKAYEKARESVAEETKLLNDRFITEHPYSWHALYLLEDTLNTYLISRWKNDPGGSKLKAFKKWFLALEMPVQQKGEYLLKLMQNEEASTVPAFTGEMPDGRIFDLASLKGRVFLLDFWGSWCASCRKGHPHLKELYARYKEKGFEIVGVGIETGTREKQWQSFKKAIAYDGITWPQVLSNPEVRDLFAEFGIKTCPTKILVDQQGKVLLRINEDSQRLIDAKLAELLDGAGGDRTM